jgi:2-phospho-L-lactate/phosphoenolpyruvate guanylyltransferase
MTAPDISSWRIVVPVKDSASAKSRLHPPPGIRRADLAHAFALDTVTAVARTVSGPNVHVVTSDRGTASFAAGLGACVVEDPGDGLNSAIRAGLEHVSATAGGGPVGVLLGDLPTVTPAALSRALQACSRHRSAFVPDAEGTGTVLLTARTLADLVPAFGAGSALAHAQQSTRLDLDLPLLRSDVDDDVALGRAVALGVGQRTAAVLACTCARLA